ncbi:MAG: heme ABC exporter ATP-binding protein CcmA [Litorivicinus sp.]
MALNIEQIRIERDERVLLDGFDLQAQPGELIQIAGPNGAGKSTLLRAIAGLYSDCSGLIQIQGESAASERRRRVLMWTALAGVKARLDARQNLKWLMDLRGDQGDLDGLLAQVGLCGWEDALAGTLSTGQARRIALASLYANDAPVWLLDEPFNAIDVQGQALLAQRIRERLSQGGVVLLATHHTPSDLMPDQVLELGASA